MPRTRSPADTVAARFSLTIDGVEIASFAELAISSAVDPADGKRPPPTVTLTRGHSSDPGIFAWHQSVVEGQGAAVRKNCTITMFDASGGPIARYHLENAWPSKVDVSSLEASGGLRERVTLVCDDVIRVTL
jgi:phage tail-like protein